MSIIAMSVLNLYHLSGLGNNQATPPKEVYARLRVLEALVVVARYLVQVNGQQLKISGGIYISDDSD